MELDEEKIKLKWSETYGKITTITVVVYGFVNKLDAEVINYAIRDSFDIDQFAHTAEEIDLDMANMFGLHRGICLQWIFPSDFKGAEIVSEMISDGLSFQRHKHEIIGVKRYVYERTT